MSYDRYTLTYNLTRDGWILTEEENLVGSPVEIWEKEVYQGSGFGSESSRLHRTWSDPGFSDHELSLLRDKFPFPTMTVITEGSVREILRSII